MSEEQFERLLEEQLPDDSTIHFQEHWEVDGPHGFRTNEYFLALTDDHLLLGQDDDWRKYVNSAVKFIRIDADDIMVGENHALIKLGVLGDDLRVVRTPQSIVQDFINAVNENNLTSNGLIKPQTIEKRTPIGIE